MDINNLRLEEEFGAGSSKAGAKGAGAAPLSLISGVKKPLGVTNRYRRGEATQIFSTRLRNASNYFDVFIFKQVSLGMKTFTDLRKAFRSLLNSCLF